MGVPYTFLTGKALRYPKYTAILVSSTSPSLMSSYLYTGNTKFTVRTSLQTSSTVQATVH